MKTNKAMNSILAAIAVAALATGCATSGYQKADKTGEGIASFRAEIINLKKAVDNTMSLLGQTSETAATDPRKAFEAFSKSVDKVESARARAGKRAADVKAAGAAYFTEWEKQLANVSNPEIRKLAEERKTKLNEVFGKLPPLLEQAKSDFDPFLSDIKDLRTFLGQDLTVGGIDAASGIIKKTRDHGTKLQKSLDGLIDEMNTVAATLTAAKVPAEKK